VYPALAVVQELKSAAVAEVPALEDVLYVGTAGGLEADIVPRAGIELRTVRAAGLRGLSPGRVLANAWALLQGVAQAWHILRTFRSDVVLATGGYASAPVVFASWLRRCPVLIYLPDIEPGLAVRFLSHLARRVAVSFEASLPHFPAGKATVTGYPVRPGLHGGDREAAKQRLGVGADAQTALILGGSRGSHSINLAVSSALEELLQELHLIHIAGQADIDCLSKRREELPQELARRYHLHAYLHDEMVDALLAADLAVARAGAATMGEFAAVGLPSVLVPYPYAGQHQDANADFMVNRGAALKLLDAELGRGSLPSVLKSLLADAPALRSMADNARKLAQPQAARAIARQLALLAGGTQ